MAAEYTIEIYEPGSLRDMWASIKSDTPLMAINAGDIINVFTGSDTGTGREQTPPNFRKSADSELRVTQVEHII